MAIGDDFSINTAGDIRHVANTNHYTVLELHRWLQNLADDEASSANDQVDITKPTPSERATDQIITLLGSYNIDDDAAEYFYGGSITQGTGATQTRYSGLKVLGAVANSSTQIQVIQDHDYYDTTTPFWGTQSGGGYNGDAGEGILMRILVKTRVAGVDIDQGRCRVQARHWGDSYDFFNVTLGDGEAVAALGTTSDPQNNIAIGTVQAWAGGDIPTNTEGYQTIDILDGNGAQPYYSKWTYNTNTLGMKAVWNWIKEITGNNSPEAATPHGMNGEVFMGITHEYAYDNGADLTLNEELVWGTDIVYDNLSGGTFTEGYLLRFSGGARGQVLYDNGTTTLKFAQMDITDTIVDDETITEYNPSTGAASGVTAQVNATITNANKEGGRGILLADNGTTTGDHWFQLTFGKAPVDGLPVYGMTSTSTVDVNGAVTARTVPKTFLGSFTGSLIGAFGIGIDQPDLTASDSVEDLDGDTNTPPNQQTFYLYGLEVGDRVLIGKKHSSNADFDFSEMTLNTALTGAAEILVDVGTGNIPADAPDSGVLRITLDDGRIRRQPYTSHDGDDGFTIASADYQDPDDAGVGKGVMLAFIDKAAGATTESFQLIYDADRTLWVRVREGTSGDPIKTYEAQAIFNNAGGSATASRLSDS